MIMFGCPHKLFFLFLSSSENWDRQFFFDVMIQSHRLQEKMSNTLRVAMETSSWLTHPLLQGACREEEPVTAFGIIMEAFCDCSDPAKSLV